MKRRNGFVSNSSSSSFLCEICGRHKVSYEGLSEVQMVECENGHTFCEHHLLEVKKKTLLEQYKDLQEKGELDEDLEVEICNKLQGALTPEEQESRLEEFEDQFDDTYADLDQDGVPADSCPICTLNYIPNELLLSYLVAATKLNLDLIADQIRSSYKNLQEVEEYINQSK